MHRLLILFFRLGWLGLKDLFLIWEDNLAKFRKLLKSLFHGQQLRSTGGPFLDTFRLDQ